jgi:hypothetical protein
VTGAVAWADTLLVGMGDRFCGYLGMTKRIALPCRN